MSGADPRPPGRGTPSAQQRLARLAGLVPTGSSTAARAPFVLLIAVLLGAGMLALLLLNASLNQGSFELSELRRQTQELTDEQQELQAEVDGYSAPDELARRAAELGLVPGGPPVFLSPDGTVLGEPVPAPEPEPEPEPEEEAEPEPEEAGPDPEEEPGPADPEPETTDADGADGADGAADTDTDTDADADPDADGAENADADSAEEGDAAADAAEAPGADAAGDADAAAAAEGTAAPTPAQRNESQEVTP